MSETMMYILFALREERHGYGIMLYTRELTRGRVVLGAGTIYQTLFKLEKNRLITSTREVNRKKFYLATELGISTLQSELRRIQEMCRAMEGML